MALVALVLADPPSSDLATSPRVQMAPVPASDGLSSHRCALVLSSAPGELALTSAWVCPVLLVPQQGPQPTPLLLHQAVHSYPQHRRRRGHALLWPAGKPIYLHPSCVPDANAVT